ncbi:hypothetical protein BDP55DRAFT_769225 [Colletotrichum godetiae]|uniref:Uncharacterized protein n=1 Tax=Colletotrichum godetiae TaxID=1209918 RepID=A0AAJ0AIF9_9PEZI|nr:uncharacterized protein BDP55DRAFT_769225 [Colletotrichum godetiae]KAK1674486.1 hypothetical protein BDP55DRAFT_769225 [Colletotrichum godetiae]
MGLFAAVLYSYCLAHGGLLPRGSQLEQAGLSHRLPASDFMYPGMGGARARPYMASIECEIHLILNELHATRPLASSQLNSHEVCVIDM